MEKNSTFTDISDVQYLFKLNVLKYYFTNLLDSKVFQPTTGNELPTVFDVKLKTTKLTLYQDDFNYDRKSIFAREGMFCQHIV